VPEGEAAAVIDDLRAASADARRRRLADQRAQLGVAPSVTPTPDTTETTPEEDDASDTPALGGDTSPDSETAPGSGGTSAEDATGGGTESP
jgi:hypothetical protein